LLRYRNSPFYLDLFRFTFLILSLFFFYFFFNEARTLPPAWPDEVLFYSPSLQLAQHGRLVTDVLIGLIPGMETKTLWMPPGYLLLSAFFLKIFDSSLMTVRTLSFLSIYLSAVLFLYLLYKLKFEKIPMILGFATIIFEPLFFRFGVPARMEGLTLLFFIGSLLIASSDLKYQIRGFVSGLLLSFSVLTHPFAASLGLTTLYLLIHDNQKRGYSIIYFLFGGILPILGWIYYISPDWDLFVIQFGAQLVRKKALFSTFDLITKLKIFIFGFAYSKIRIIIILSQLSIMTIFSFQLWKHRETLPKRFGLYWIWILSVLISIYSSSEGWYVIYFLFPFALGMAILSEQKYIGIKLTLFGIVISVFGWFHFIFLHHVKTNSELIQTQHFERIYASLKEYKKIYVQAIPDPYFYLKEKNPEIEILEFIPGELSIPSEIFRKTISEQEAFIFYNEELKNQAIGDFLKENPDWIREEWEIPVPTQHWLAYKTIIYKKPKPNFE
jgi:hypothetical protein